MYDLCAPLKAKLEMDYHYLSLKITNVKLHPHVSSKSIQRDKLYA